MTDQFISGAFAGAIVVLMLFGAIKISSVAAEHYANVQLCAQKAKEIGK